MSIGAVTVGIVPVQMSNSAKDAARRPVFLCTFWLRAADDIVWRNLGHRVAAPEDYRERILAQRT
jgi:hypothetical protein